MWEDRERGSVFLLCIFNNRERVIAVGADWVTSACGVWLVDCAFV